MTDDEGRIVLRRGRTEHGWTLSDEAPLPPPTPRAERRPDGRNRVARMLPYAVAATFGLAAMLSFLALSFRSFEAQGMSMEPAVHDGDGVLVARIVYEEVDFGLLNWLPLYDSSSLRWGSPGRGDVVVFDSPVRDERLVKRVIGMPGDTVRIRDGAVYVNGERLEEPYAHGATDCLNACGEVVIGEDQYFVLGDNRANSVDSRQGWTIGRSDITGKVLFSY